MRWASWELEVISGEEWRHCLQQRLWVQPGQTGYLQCRSNKEKGLGTDSLQKRFQVWTESMAGDENLSKVYPGGRARNTPTTQLRDRERGKAEGSP